MLDLFSGQGGAAAGYHTAGFDVIGVDHKPQPRYPYRHTVADWTTGLTEHLHGVTLIHASPPCQAYSRATAVQGTRHQHPDLIADVRDALTATGLPYVIENVKTAMHLLHNPILMCGIDFHLDVLRYRAFEIPWLSDADRALMPCLPRWHGSRVGEGRYVTVAGKPGGSSTRDNTRGASTAQWAAAMGITWMSAAGLAQAIPPAYTHWIGQRFLTHH